MQPADRRTTARVLSRTSASVRRQPASVDLTEAVSLVVESDTAVQDVAGE